MRIAFRYLVAIVALLGLASYAWAGGQSESQSTHGASVKVHTINLLTPLPLTRTVNPLTGQTLPGLNKLIAEFEKTHPNIKVDGSYLAGGPGAVLAKAQAMFASDSVDVYLQANADKLWIQGEIMGLSKLEKKDPIMSRFPRYVLQGERVTYGGHLIGIPQGLANNTLVYDKKIFQDYGVPLPGWHPTAQEIMSDIPKLTGIDPVTHKKTYGFWMDGRWMLNYVIDIFNNGFPYITNANQLFNTYQRNWHYAKFQFYTPQNVERILRVVELTKYAPIQMLSGAGDENWGRKNNDIAIIPWAGSALMQQSLKDGLTNRFIVTGGIVDSKGRTAYLSIPVVSIAKKTSSVKDSWELTSFLTSVQAAKFYYDNYNEIPITKDHSFIPASDPYAKAFADAVAPGRNLSFPPFYIQKYRPFLNTVMAHYLNGASVSQIKAEIVSGLKTLDSEGRAWTAAF